MASPIRRLVQLVYDRAAGQKTEAEAKKTLGTVDRGLEGLRSTALKLGGVLAAAFGTRQILRWGKESLRAGIASAETFSKFNTVFGESAPLVDDFVMSFRAMAGLTRSEGREMVATMGAIFQGLGASTEASAQMSTEVVALAGDLQSFHDVPIGETFAALRSGLTGETEPLKRFGIILKQTAAQQRALTMTGKESVEQLTEEELAAARLSIIYEQAGVAVGDLDRTKGSLANRIRRLAGWWRELQVAVGEAITQSNDATGVLDVLTEALKNATAWVDNNHAAFSTLGEVLGFTVRWFGRIADGVWRFAQLASGAGIGAFGFLEEGAYRLNRALAGTLESLAEVVDKIPGLGNVADALKERAEELREEAAMQEINAEAARETAAALFEQALATRDVAKAEKERDSAPSQPQRQGGGGDAGQSDAAAEEARRLANEAAEITEAFRTPAQVYVDTVRRLRDHLAAGRIDQETFNRAMMEARSAFDEATEAARGGISKVDEALQLHEQNVATAKILALSLGEGYSVLEEEARSITATLRALAEQGIGPTDERFAGLVARLHQVRQGMSEVENEAKTAGEAATIAGELVGAAFGAGIGPLAAGKAKQNAIMAAEQLALGLVASLNPFTAPKAAGHFTAAAKFGAIAAAWGSLAGVAGGGGVGGGGGGAGGGAGVGAPSARSDIGGPRSEGSSSPAPEINLFLEGEGFDAINPKVQRVVFTALQEAQASAGGNARVRTFRGRNRQGGQG